MPSVVSARSAPLATSWSHRFQSRTNTPREPSGESASGLLSDDVAPPPPPRPPRPPPAPRPPRPPPAGSRVQSTPAAAQSANAFRDRFAGSTTTISLPLLVGLRNQKRPSGSHTGATVPPTTSPATFGARNFS